MMTFKEVSHTLVSIGAGFLILLGIFAVGIFIVRNVDRVFSNQTPLFAGFSGDTPSDVQYVGPPAISKEEHISLPVIENQYKNIDNSQKIVYPGDYYPYSDN